MDYETATEAWVSAREACAELRAHGFMADYDDNELFDCVTGETIARAKPEGEFYGADVLGWLGY